MDIMSVGVAVFLSIFAVSVTLGTISVSKGNSKISAALEAVADSTDEEFDALVSSVEQTARFVRLMAITTTVSLALALICDLTG